MSAPCEKSAANILEFILSAHSTTVPTPYVMNVCEEDEVVYRRKLAEHVNEWCELQAKAPLCCTKAIWSDFTCDFSPEGSASMSNPAVIRVRNLLLEKGIFVSTPRGFSKREALPEPWKADDCSLSSGGQSGSTKERETWDGVICEPNFTDAMNTSGRTTVGAQ